MTLEQFCLHYFPPVFSTRAPDGSCILTNSADNVLRLHNLPPQIYSYNWDSLPEMVDAHHIKHEISPRKRKQQNTEERH